MKNKGRKHKAGKSEEMTGILNCKGLLTHISRPIRSMSRKGRTFTKFEKKKWIKRMRGYLKHDNSDKF